MIGHWWHSYWGWAGSNIGAMPAEAVITIAFGLLVSRPAVRLWRRIVGEHPAVAEARLARRIAADLYEHHTGRAHPDAPEKTGSEA